MGSSLDYMANEAEVPNPIPQFCAEWFSQYEGGRWFRETLSWTCSHLDTVVPGPHSPVVVHRVLQSLFDQVLILRNAPSLWYSITCRTSLHHRGNPTLGSVLPAHRGSATAFSAYVIKVNSLFIGRNNGIEKFIRLGASKQNSHVGNTCHFVVIGELMWDPSTASIRFAGCVQMIFNSYMGTVECLRQLLYCLRWIRLYY